MQKSLRKLRKSQTGFSLIEIIMSIGILAIMSIFIMQMYIKAASLKEMAFDKDYALSAAQTALEVYKSHGPDPENWLNAGSLFSKEAVVNRINESSNYAVEYYYDKNWQPANDKPAQGYTLRITIETQENIILPGDLIQTEVSVIRIHPYLLSEENNTILCNLHSGSYFPFLLSERT